MLCAYLFEKMSDEKRSISGETSEEFVENVKRNLLGGMVGIVVAIGMETGLFDVLISLEGKPKTSQEIADAGNFKERYVSQRPLGIRHQNEAFDETQLS